MANIHVTTLELLTCNLPAIIKGNCLLLIIVFLSAQYISTPEIRYRTYRGARAKHETHALYSIQLLQFAHEPFKQETKSLVVADCEKCPEHCQPATAKQGDTRNFISFSLTLFHWTRSTRRGYDKLTTSTQTSTNRLCDRRRSLDCDPISVPVYL